MMGGSFEKVKDLFVDQRLMGEFDSKAKGQNYIMFSELNPDEFVKKLELELKKREIVAQVHDK